MLNFGYSYLVYACRMPGPLLVLLLTCLNAAAAGTSNTTTASIAKAAAPLANITDAAIDPVGTAETANITEISSTKDAPPSVDYSNFARMLAGMLILREGGLPEATRAIPALSAEAFNYLGAQVFLDGGIPSLNHPPANITSSINYAIRIIIFCCLGSYSGVSSRQCFCQHISGDMPMMVQTVSQEFGKPFGLNQVNIMQVCVHAYCWIPSLPGLG